MITNMGGPPRRRHDLGRALTTAAGGARRLDWVLISSVLALG